MPALYPSMVAPEDFCVGDCVRKFITESCVTPYLGVVTQIVPSTYKVWVQWPMANSQEDPESLIKVNPLIYGMPTVKTDYGYSSYEKSKSPSSLPVRQATIIPHLNTATEKMAIRIAHTFATEIVGNLLEDISDYKNEGHNDVQTYNRIFNKYGSICSDHIIKSSIEKIFKG